MYSIDTFVLDILGVHTIQSVVVCCRDLSLSYRVARFEHNTMGAIGALIMSCWN